MAAKRWSRGVPIGHAGRVPRDRWGVEIDNQTMITSMKDLAERAYPKTGRAVEVEMEALLQETVRTWPVKSGFSKETIRILYRILGDQFVTSIEVGAYYALMIKSKGTSPGRKLLDAGDGLIERLHRRIVEALSNE